MRELSRLRPHRLRLSMLRHSRLRLYGTKGVVEGVNEIIYCSLSGEKSFLSKITYQHNKGILSLPLVTLVMALIELTMLVQHLAATFLPLLAH